MALAQTSPAAFDSRRLAGTWLPLAFRLVAVLLAGLHVWAGIANGSMSEDGINYLDMGDAFFRGEWGVAINPVWSPLYGLLLGAAMRIVAPPVAWEFGVVQLVNFGLFIFALACFEFFWGQLRRHRVATTSSQATTGLPEWAWVALGYSLFVWSALCLIEIWVVTPDMLVAALVYLIAGLAVRIHCGAATWRGFALLGVLLGIAYLTKAVMFPLALVFLSTALFTLGSLRRTLPRMLVALALLVLVAGPFVGAISIAKGKLTIGEAGTLTYVRYVNGVPYPHWQGEEPGSGTPSHPSRRILESPPIYEFGSPIGGTYPISYDPSYWYDGVAVRLDPGQQARALLTSALYYFDLFFRQQGGMLVGVAILYLVGVRPWLRRERVALPLLLLVPALAAFALYSLVYVESRYLGPFVVLLWAGLLAGVRLPERVETKRLASVVSAVMALFMLANVAAFNLEGLRVLSTKETAREGTTQVSPPARAGQVVEELVQLGIAPGDEVAVVGYAFDSFWARLGRVKIVAEMFGWEADPFWLGDRSGQARVIEAFASTGAKAIVAEEVPAYANLTGWHRVGDSNYYVYALDR